MDQVNKALAPVNKFFKGNVQMIDLVLLGLVVFMVLPVDRLLNVNFQSRIEGMLKNLVTNPIVMAVMAVVVYSAYGVDDANSFCSCIIPFTQIINALNIK